MAAQTIRDAAEIDGEPARARARAVWAPEAPEARGGPAPDAGEARGGPVPDAGEARGGPVRATKAERRVLVGTVVATLLVLGVLLLALHLELQDYVIRMGPWSY